MTIEGSTNGDVFTAFVEHVLVPTLSLGDIVVMDNVRFHYRETGITMIEAAGATAKFLPPYSPDFNPIESCWSKIKEMLRRAQARTREALDVAVANAVDAVTPDDAVGWFRGCGYVL